LILAAIIETYIKYARPVGSSHLIEEFDLHVSPATVRNDMMWLEKNGLITQPFTSAGRIPTEIGLRKFVDEMMDEFHFTVPTQFSHKIKEINEISDTLKQQKVRRKVKEAVELLADISDNVSFATMPWVGDVYYLGLANVLKKPEFGDAYKVSTVVEVLEDRDNFFQMLDRLQIGGDIKVFIGHENVIEAIQSCTLMATAYTIYDEFVGVIGILGPVRMHYSRNIAALNAVKNDIIQQ
jgi:transcriptional regulator of heat shock response